MYVVYSLKSFVVYIKIYVIICILMIFKFIFSRLIILSLV